MALQPSTSPSSAYRVEDFDHSPFLVFYELTRACDLVCRHCRACAQPKPHPKELDTQQSEALLEELTQFPKPPLVVLTGGDPFKRSDLFHLIRYGREHGLRIAITPSATPLVTDEALRHLHEAGINRMALSLDGADAATHDGFRGFEGSYRWTFQIMRSARKLGLPLQINTTLTQRNVHQVDAFADLLAPEGITLWSVFFLVPVGRGLKEQRLRPHQCETVFARLWHHAQRQPFAIKTTEAPHYRRFVRQQKGDPLNAAGAQNAGQRAPLGTNDGRGVMFVSHTGQVFPSGFLPIESGRFPRDSVVDVYQQAPLFRQLRDPDQLKGKCGECEFRGICGGSRARAYAVHRDPLAAEPDCAYQPQTLQPESQPC